MPIYRMDTGSVQHITETTANYALKFNAYSLIVPKKEIIEGMEDIVKSAQGTFLYVKENSKGEIVKLTLGNKDVILKEHEPGLTYEYDSIY
jgi:hypothetical protein